MPLYFSVNVWSHPPQSVRVLPTELNVNMLAVDVSVYLLGMTEHGVQAGVTEAI